MEANVYDKFHEVELKQTMEQSYVDYAMSVITSRAIPDVRDGLKPVQRRVLYAMYELHNTPDQPHRKCARIVGDAMGKYHPHGDSSIYGSLVYMAQPWNEHYPLVDGHGNFGSVDGDGAAAMRYTEARLSKIAMEMLADMGKDTVDLVPNFDETEKEPAILPARVPNLLINGAQGIAVGMATNIPPHNLREVGNAICRIINNRVEEGRETTIEEIMQDIQGPDFPTGAVILGRNGISQAYRTGRGKIRVRSIYTIEPMENGRNRVVITEIPYLVNKQRLIGKIAELHRDKRVEGIMDVRDETNDREGTRVVLELRHDVNANVVMNQLLRHTDLQTTYGVIMLALVNGEPKVLNILDALRHYIRHQESVVTRRCRFDLKRAEDRAHIIEGLFIALDNIDEIIRIIRAAANVGEAKENLIKAFALTDAQAQAIVDMRLRALTGLERSKLEEEYAELTATIARLREILGDENKLLLVIRDELAETIEKYGDERKTRIENDEDEIEDEDLISDEEVVIAMTKLGYLKRMSLDIFRAQNRGGRGIKGMAVLNDDYTTGLQLTGTKDNMLFFSNQGRIYLLKAYEIPVASRTSRGTPLINLIQLQPGEKVTAMITGKGMSEEEAAQRYIVMATKSGTIKKTPAKEYSNVRKNGLIAITLKEGDELISVKETAGNEDVLLVAKSGNSIRFNEESVRICGRSSIGVRGMDLRDGDELVSMEVASSDQEILFVSENGLGKRTYMSEFNPQGRGGKGSRGYKITEKTGGLVGTATVTGDDEIMLMTTEGIVIRTVIDSIPILSKTTSGVKLMNIDKEGEARVASFTIIPAAAETEDAGTDEDADDGLTQDASDTPDPSEDENE
ncbi:MAG: DNA gyrase subunit A [Lachnospiraceae bacterium]|nr:DNA gyrase subunit A [Lachnospiraceae bacterium]